MRSFQVVSHRVPFFAKGDILEYQEKSSSRAGRNAFCSVRPRRAVLAFVALNYLVEIDSDGNTIRTYSLDDIDINGGTIVNKSEALSRLDALEAEAKKLREILSKPEEPVEYYSTRAYVATRARAPKNSAPNCYMLLGGSTSGEDSFAFYSLENSTARWDSPTKSAQDAIINIIKDGFQVREYDSKRAALSAMLERM